MKGIIQVVTQAEFDEWIAKQKPYYYTAFPDKDPANEKVDSTKKVAINSSLTISSKDNTKI